jgi:hypothetical protein
MPGARKLQRVGIDVRGLIKAIFGMLALREKSCRALSTTIHSRS